MSTPTPVPPNTAPTPQQPVPPEPGYAPSNSTSASLLGGSLATVIILLLAQRGITFQAGMESALAVLFTTLAGYLPKSGRR